MLVLGVASLRQGLSLTTLAFQIYGPAFDVAGLGGQHSPARLLALAMSWH